MYLAVVLTVFGGARRGELYRMRWKDLNMGLKKLDIPQGVGENNAKITGRGFDMFAPLFALLTLIEQGNPDDLISIATQWLGLPLHVRQVLLSHRLDSSVTVAYYNGRASSQWAHDFVNLTLEQIFETVPSPCKANDLA
jgi:hypothetical protein